MPGATSVVRGEKACGGPAAGFERRAAICATEGPQVVGVSNGERAEVEVVDARVHVAESAMMRTWRPFPCSWC